MGHSCRNVPYFGADDYSSYGDDVHMNNELFVAGFRDLYSIWCASSSIVTDQYDIKYCGGICNQGLTYYRDRRLPDTIVVDGRVLDYDFTWWVHETTEWSLANVAGRHKDILIGRIAMVNPSSPLTVGPVSRVHYRIAHQAAEAMEERLVEAMGYNVDSYVHACDAMIATIGNQPLYSSPRNLDLYPYEDEGDMDSLVEIANTGGPSSYMLYQPGVQGGSDGRPFYE